MWLCAEGEGDAKKLGAKQQEAVSGSGVEGQKYVRRDEGLFPAPLPQEGSLVEALEHKFRFLGAFLGKALLDGRLVSLPMAEPVYKVCTYCPADF
jgi:E3 ubiquitin-protein ligase HECTD1